MIKANVHLFNFSAMTIPIQIYVINQKQKFKGMYRRGQDQDSTVHCSHLRQKNHSAHIC